MKAIIIGGSGHIGKFLSRMFVDGGWETTIVSSGRTAIEDEVVKKHAKLAKCGYSELISDGCLKEIMQENVPNVVVDILQGLSPAIYDLCLEMGVGQYVMCGSLWMFGRPKVVPTPEITQTPCPFDAYQTRYDDMQRVIEKAEGKSCSACAVMPPNICGPGKIPLDGDGGRSMDSHRSHRAGKKVVMPYPGTNTVGPCDAEDVAQGFYRAAQNPEAASGEIFNVGSAYALTSELFINTYADIYGVKTPIEYVQPDVYETQICPDLGANYHFMEHMCPDIKKISSKLNYVPKHTPEETMERAVKWMLDNNMF